MPKPPNWVELGPLCASWYAQLPEGEQRKSVDVMLDTLQERENAGEHVRRRLWPKHPAYEGISNLFRYAVDKEMRASYTIVRDRTNLKVVIIEIFPDHKRYERRFGY